MHDDSKQPVAWRYQTPTGWHATTDAQKAVSLRAHHPVEPLYAAPQASEAVRPALAVWYGSMPESNGKKNWTAILYRKGEVVFDGPHITIDRSEYPDRVRYEADRVRHLIGEIDEEPWILDYDADKCEHPAQADKDGGDCAKGAGDGQQKYWLCCGSKDPNHPNRRAPDCFNADRAKWGTADQHSVVKQSLTATQTGEKGESDAG